MLVSYSLAECFESVSYALSHVIVNASCLSRMLCLTFLIAGNFYPSNINFERGREEGREGWREGGRVHMCACINVLPKQFCNLVAISTNISMLL